MVRIDSRKIVEKHECEREFFMNKSYNNILKSIYDEFIISDIENKIGVIDDDNLDEIIERVIKYVKRHYVIDYQKKRMRPRIANFYRKHKKFTRCMLISISIFDENSDIIDLVKQNNFNKCGKWEVDHIVPISQKYNKFSKRNFRLKNRLGNLTLLTKDTNSRISNESFYQKRKVLDDNERMLKVNEIFNVNKINISKKDIRAREEELNGLIYKIFIENDGEIFKSKIRMLKGNNSINVVKGK